MPAPGSRRTDPTEKQISVLRALADASNPMRSSELATRSGIFDSEVRMVCKWLKVNGYIVDVLKKERVQIGHSSVLKHLAYWSLTDKGRAFCLLLRVP